ncbi:DUF1905 domain-containing protein [Cellulosimicrobium cellulans]|nr:DUF1905 domain-containing protein [Cellulosimicrobium cellulans]
MVAPRAPVREGWRRWSRAGDARGRPDDAARVGGPRHHGRVAGTRFEFEAELWRWEARTDSWVFAALPEDVSDEIAELPLPPAGFGSVKVEVTLGAQRWSTSVFPDAQRKTFVVPIKAAVRRAEGVDVGDRVTIGVETLL